MKFLLLFPLMLLTNISLFAQYNALRFEKMCIGVQHADFYQVASTCNAPGCTSKIEIIGPGNPDCDITYDSYSNIMGYYFTPQQHGEYFAFFTQKFLGITTSSDLIGSYTTIRNDLVLNIPIDALGNPVTAKAMSSITLTSGFLATGSNTTFVTDLTNTCPNVFRRALKPNIAKGDNQTNFSKDTQQLNINNKNISMKETLFPNPVATGKVSFGTIVEKFQVFDYTGKLVKEGYGTDGFDVTKLNKGVYLVKTEGQTTRLIIQ